MFLETACGEFHASATTVDETPIQLATGKPRLKKGVRIEAHADNTDNIYVGTSASVSASDGFPLDAGEFVDVPIDDLSKVWIVGGDTGQVAKWIAA